MKARKIQIVLYVLLILFCVGFYIFDIMVNHTDPSDHLMKFILVIAACIIGILRSGRSQRRASLSVYEKSYAKELRNAFSTEEKTRKELLLAVRLYDENKLGKALKSLTVLKSKCKRSDDYFAVGLFMALCFTDMHLYQEAINEYQQIITRQLETSTIYNNLGHIHSRLGKKKEAMEYYKQSLELSDENEFTYVNIANMYFSEKEFEPAISYALKALDINCKLKQAANLLAIIYSLQEDNENADKYFHMAISAGSNPSELKNAINYYKTGLEETE